MIGWNSFKMSYTNLLNVDVEIQGTQLVSKYANGTKCTQYT